MENKYLGSTGLAKLLERLFETFSEVGHTHTKSQISDFPTVPTNTSQLTNDSGFITANDLSGNITVDSELSDSSMNPVQNKVIKSEFDTVKGQIDDMFADKVGVTPQSLTAEQKLQARTNIGALSADNMDQEPIANSKNPVTSGGLYNVMEEINSLIMQAGCVATLALPGSLKWDGHINDRPHVVISIDGDETVFIKYALVHVSDYGQNIMTILSQIGESLSGGAAICAMGSVEVTEYTININEDGSVATEFFVYAPHDGYVMDGSLFPKAGWYFMCQIVSIPMLALELQMAYTSALMLRDINFPDNSLSGNSDVSRYFEKITTVSDAKYVGDTLTWDGNIDGRFYIEISETEGAFTATQKLVKMSDSIPTEEDFKNGCSVSMNGNLGGEPESETVELTYDNMVADGLFLGDGCIQSGYVFIVPYDNYTLSVLDDNISYVFPEAGTYFLDIDAAVLGIFINTASFTIPGYNFSTATYKTAEVIKTEHLPEALQFGEFTTTSETGGDTLTYDGNPFGYDYIIDGVVLLSSNVLTYYDVQNGIVNNITGDVVEVTQNDFWDDGGSLILLRTGQFSDDGAEILNGVIIVPYDGYDAFGKQIPKAGIWVAAEYPLSITIPGYTGFPTVTTETVKIDPKYIPFFEPVDSLEFSGVEVSGDTLRWNGNIDGKLMATTPQGENVISGDSVFTRISSATPTIDDFTNGAILVATASDGETVEYKCEIDGSISDGVLPIIQHDSSAIILALLLVAVVPYDGLELDGVVFPKAGIYILSGKDSVNAGARPISLTIPGYKFPIPVTDTEPNYVIKTEHLPEHLHFGEITKTVGGDTLTWDGNTEGLVNAIDVAYKVSDIVPTVNDMSAGIVLDASIPEDYIVLSRDESVEQFNDYNIYKAAIEVKLPYGVIIYPSVFIVPHDMAGVDLGGYSFPEAGIYVTMISEDCFIKSFTINGYTGFGTTTTETVKIDPKYLPDGFGGEGGSLPEVSTADDGKTLNVVNGEWVVSKPNFEEIKHISNKASGTYYYKLGTMVADNASNYGNITISGRLGGWEQSNSANFDIMMLNRSSARDGNTITATVSASGQVDQALSKCDIVVYRQDDTSEIVYLKLNGYWLYDFDWNTFQHSVSYTPTNVTPTGTLVWSLSSAPKTVLDANGSFYINGSKAVSMMDVGSAVAPAYTFGSTDLVAGSTQLTTGVLHFVYE